MVPVEYSTGETAYHYFIVICGLIIFFGLFISNVANIINFLNGRK